jgi:Putative regulator of cell autolysis
MINRLLLCIILSLLNMPVSAVYYKQYTTNQRLNSNTIYSIYKDSKGYLWFATSRGVCKYDGLSFKLFGLADGLGDDFIFYFIEDKAQRIWLTTLNGRNCYIKNDSVYNALNDSTVSAMPPVMINAMSFINDTSFYFGAPQSAGIFKMDGLRYTQLYKLPSDEQTCLLIRSKGLLYMYNSQSTVIYNEITRKKTIVPTPKRSVFSSHNKLLITDTAGISIFENGKLTWFYNDPELTSSNVNQLYADTSGYIFCSTNTGLRIINYHNNQSRIIFPKLSISAVTQDIAGNYWIATSGSGAFCLHKELFNLSPLLNLANVNVLPGSNKFFFMENDSLKYFSPPHNKILPLPFDYSYDTRSYPIYLDSNYFFYTYRTSFSVYDHKNRCTFNGFGSLKGVVPIGKDKFIIKMVPLLVAVEFKNGHLIYGDSIIHKKRITGIQYHKQDHSIYYAVDNELFRYDIAVGRNESIGNVSVKDDINNLYSLDDKLVVFTNNMHWYIYTAGKKLTGPFTLPAGISVTDVFTINGDFIIATNKGVYLWKVNTHRLSQPILAEYPFRSVDMSWIGVHDSTILCDVGGQAFAYNAALLRQDKNKPIFYIDKVITNGESHNTTSIQLNNIVVCDVRVLLSTLHFYNSEVSYKFRILYNGHWGEWMKTEGKELYLHLENHGNYRIDIMAVTGNGVNSTIKSVYLNLSPPFYFTTLFYCIVITVILMGCIYTVYHYQAHRKKQLQDELDHLQLEYKAVNSLLNPHFVFNAINNIQQLIHEGSKETANDYLAKLSRLIRQNIENLQFSLISLDNELALVQNYLHLQNLRFSNKINYQLINNIGALDNINVPPLLIHTIVENAIVHGFKKEGSSLSIVIDLSLSTDDYVIITIADDGVGYYPNNQSSPEKSSIGLEAMRARLERLSSYFNVRYVLSIDNRKDTNGTIVTIILHSKLRDFTVS